MPIADLRCFSTALCHIQWNLSNEDTIGTKESVLITEVSSFQRVKCMVFINLGPADVSLLERCPHLGGVL